jgi:hypothetical protein
MNVVRRSVPALVLVLASTTLAMLSVLPAAAPGWQPSPALGGDQAALPTASSTVAAEPATVVDPGPSRPDWRHIRIPAAGVDAEIEPVFVDGRGNMAVPSRSDRVGWYAGGPSPGSPGDAVLDGHLDTAAGSAVFGELHRLKAGDQLIVDWSGGRTYTFIVESVRLYSFDAHPDGLFAADGPTRLSLITCAGPWDARLGTYRQRLVVDAHLA